MTPTPVDLILKVRWLAPVVPKNQLLENCAVVVDRGVIKAITTHKEADARYQAKQQIELDEHLLIPGLVNAHGHGAMSLLRGYADDKPLHSWLNDHIWPAEQQWVDAEFVRDGTNLAMAEMIRSGTTCFADMYFFPEAIAETASRSGMRAQVAFPVFDFPSNWGNGPDDYIHKGLALRDACKNDNMIQIAFGPHAPYTVSDGPLQQVATYSEELATPIHIHLHETAQEVNDAVNGTGMRPIERLYQLGALSPLTQCVHLTQVDNSDIALLSDSGAQVIHCPESNLKLASGFCPVQELLSNDINVALGTDGAASNNDLSLLSEIKTAALLAKAVASDASALSAHTALRMATLNGAKALGMADRIGSIEVGKAADLTAVRMDDLETLPLYNPISQLVYTDCSHRVSHVWANGKALLQERQLTTLDHKEITSKALEWQEKIANS
ncbi:TRZ/ATZ family hydrolase [bacterium SCSIO 12696]|nr:TRZ/ATZ family hydrolase [bacterium SCSIO 12696]